MILQPASREDYRQIKELYLTAFPDDERAPFFLIRLRAMQGRAEMLTAKEGAEFIGFAYVVTDRDMVYLFYFAIDSGKRGSGNGSQVLKLLKERYAGKRFFLAREQLDKQAENYEERVRRHQFYLKNGLSDLPNRIQEASVIYDIMGIGGSISAAEYDRLIRRWSGWLLKKMIKMQILEDEAAKN